MTTKMFERTVGPRVVRLRCNALLEPQAEALLATLGRLSETPKGIGPGTSIQFGWARLELRERDGALWVTMPDYRGDPEEGSVDELDDLFVSLTAQVELHRALGVAPQPFSAYDTLTAAMGWRELDSLLFYRVPPDLRGDSGWRIAAPDAPEAPIHEQEVQYALAFRLLEDCPAMFAALALPTGTRVLIERGARAAITLPDGRTVVEPTRPR